MFAYDWYLKARDIADTESIFRSMNLLALYDLLISSFRGRYNPMQERLQMVVRAVRDGVDVSITNIPGAKARIPYSEAQRVFENFVAPRFARERDFFKETTLSSRATPKLDTFRSEEEYDWARQLLAVFLVTEGGVGVPADYSTPPRADAAVVRETRPEAERETRGQRRREALESEWEAEDAREERGREAEDAREERERAEEDAREERERAEEDAREERERAEEDAREEREREAEDAREERERAGEDAREERERAGEDAREEREREAEDERQARERRLETARLARATLMDDFWDRFASGANPFTAFPPRAADDEPLWRAAERQHSPGGAGAGADTEDVPLIDLAGGSVSTEDIPLIDLTDASAAMPRLERLRHLLRM
jgi:hypothetical protein